MYCMANVCCPSLLLLYLPFRYNDLAPRRRPIFWAWQKSQNITYYILYWNLFNFHSVLDPVPELDQEMCQYS